MSTSFVAGALDTFLAATALGPEHRRLMDEHHRPIDWAGSTASSLAPDARGRLARMWRRRMVSEQRSVGIFAQFTLDLLAAGAPAEVLSLSCRASLDEVRHAELFARLASLYSGAPETPPPGFPPLPDDPSTPLPLQAVRGAMHLSFCAETYSCVLLSELHARATDPAVKGALGAVLADEIYHARLGWVMVVEALRSTRPELAGARELLEREAGPALARFAADSFGTRDEIAPTEPPIDPVEQGHGAISSADERELFEATVRDVWAPGFRVLGLPLG